MVAQDRDRNEIITIYRQMIDIFLRLSTDVPGRRLV